MSKSALRKVLASMSQEELVQTLLEAYDARKETKEYFEYWLNPDEKKAYDNALRSLDKQFFNSKERPLRKASATACKKIISDFSSLGTSASNQALLWANYCSILVAWISGKRFRRSYESWAARVYLAALRNCENADLSPAVMRRIDQLADKLEELYSALIPLPRPECRAEADAINN